MTKGPLDVKDTVRNRLPSAKKMRRAAHVKAYYRGVYEVLLFLSVASEDATPKQVNEVLDGLVEDCERVVQVKHIKPSRRRRVA